MKPKRIILIRHGQSVGNVDRTAYITTPDYQIELTDEGRKQAREAGARLATIIGNESVRAYVSPYYRTRQTYEEVCKSINVVQKTEDPRIREQEWGNLAMPGDYEMVSAERDAFGTFYYRPTHGENGADVYDRVTTFLETMHRDFKKDDFPDNCLIVTHGLTLRLFLMRWLHWEVEIFERMRNPHNTQFFILEKQADSKYRLTEDVELYEKPRHEK